MPLPRKLPPDVYTRAIEIAERHFKDSGDQYLQVLQQLPTIIKLRDTYFEAFEMATGEFRDRERRRVRYKHKYGLPEECEHDC